MLDGANSPVQVFEEHQGAVHARAVTPGREESDGVIYQARLEHCFLRIHHRPSAGTCHLQITHGSGTLEFGGARARKLIVDGPGAVRLGSALIIYGGDCPLASIRKRALRVAPSDLSVLLTGDTGVGKEVLAREMHEASRLEGDFVAVNCGALAPDLVAAELFGHERGAFSGACRARPGLIRAARGGTLFLDEIGDLPLDLQCALLRVLEAKLVRPVGAEREVAVDFRVIAATHQDLRREVRRGRFRQDLLARLGEAIFEVPPLRQRPLNVLPLARAFAEQQGRTLRMTLDVAQTLVDAPWPMNVRELRSLVRLYLALSDRGDTMDLTFLRTNKPELFDSPGASSPAHVHGPFPAMGAPQPEERARWIVNALRRVGGNVSAAAGLLNVSRSTLYREIRRFGLDMSQLRPGQAIGRSDTGEIPVEVALEA